MVAKDIPKKSRIAAVIVVILIALVARIRTVNVLPIHVDEPAYLNAAWDILG